MTYNKNDDVTPPPTESEENAQTMSEEDMAAMFEGMGADLGVPSESSTQGSSQPLQHQELATTGAGELAETRPLDAVYDVPVQLSAVLGKAHMPVNQLLKLGRGAVVELDRRVGEPVDIFVNNKLIARGEVVLVEDRLGITMTEIIKADRV